eukprot:2514279-Ditylum_brightwellii.AAC.1
MSDTFGSGAFRPAHTSHVVIEYRDSGREKTARGHLLMTSRPMDRSVDVNNESREGTSDE